MATKVGVTRVILDQPKSCGELPGAGRAGLSQEAQRVLSDKRVSTHGQATVCGWSCLDRGP
jgi:hypothetical protein